MWPRSGIAKRKKAARVPWRSLWLTLPSIWKNELRREELAEAVHLNPDYMARLFKKETGMNLKDYIIQQKMQEAQSLLCTTNLPISLIAAKVGYTNFGHFSTSYKKFYHKTPQEERSAAL